MQEIKNNINLTLDIIVGSSFAIHLTNVNDWAAIVAIIVGCIRIGEWLFDVYKKYKNKK